MQKSDTQNGFSKFSDYRECRRFYILKTFQKILNIIRNLKYYIVYMGNLKVSEMHFNSEKKFNLNII